MHGSRPQITTALTWPLPARLRLPRGRAAYASSERPLRHLPRSPSWYPPTASGAAPSGVAAILTSAVRRDHRGPRRVRRARRPRRLRDRDDGRAARSGCCATSASAASPVHVTRASWRRSAITWRSATTTTSGCPDKVSRQVERSSNAPDRRSRRDGVHRSCTRIGHRPERRRRCGVLQPVAARSRTQEIHPSSILARREAYIDGIGLVDEAIPGSYGEDYEWMLRAARRAPILVVRQPLVRAYWHRTSFFADRWNGSSTRSSICWRGIRSSRVSREVSRDCTVDWRSPTPRWVTDRRPGSGLGGRSGSTSLERRAYLALCVSSGLVSSDRLLRMAHRTGKGI